MEKPTILVADDEEYIVDILATILEDEGYTILKAYDGIEALNLARRNSLSLVITDAMMPKMSGIDLIRHLKEETGTRGVPTILLSCVIQVPPDSAATQFISKPFDVDSLVQSVKRHTAQRDKEV